MVLGINFTREEKIKATTDLQSLFDMGANAETWDNAAKAAYAVKMKQLLAGAN